MPLSFRPLLKTNPRLGYATVLVLVILFTLFLFLDDVSKITDRTIDHMKSKFQDPPALIQEPPPPSRLALTLKFNEERYQDAVKERDVLMNLTAKTHPKLESFPTPGLYTLWDFFVPAFSCPFPVYRVGTLGDGGKYVCGLERALSSKESCVVYSMGVEQQSSFEETVLTRFPKCEVFGFDYSVTNWGPQLRANETLLERAHFNQYKITGVDNHATIPKTYSMQGIMEEKNHTFVDILKMDIEGAEFETLEALIKSFNGEPLPFGQLQLEIHAGWKDFDTVPKFDKWWRILEDAGLRPFWTEPNLMHANNYRKAPDVSEWSFINIRGNHPLLDDSLPDYP